MTPATRDYNMAHAESFIDRNYSTDFSIDSSGSARQFSIAITNIVAEWANNRENNGILLFNPDFIQGVQLLGISAPVDRQPALIIPAGFDLEY